MSIREDIRTVFEKDPAARSTLEVICCYPGMHALWMHRIAHRLWSYGLHFPARLLSHISRALTGVEIHPGATIGRRVFIDHGSGIVIGETAEVGDDVLIYMGVVLGGTSLTKGKRHPTIGNNVTIGSGAAVLGPIEIGEGARVGAGSVVVRPVPAGATVIGVPGRIAGPDEPRAPGVLDHGDMPDPMLRVVSRLLDRQSRLEERIFELERDHVTKEAKRHELIREEEVRKALRTVIDPEVGIDIVDLGLVKEVHVEDDTVLVSMVLTTSACPLVDYLKDQVKRTVLGLGEIKHVEVEILDEPFNWDRFVSQKGKRLDH
ncbi:serine acetyltransferase [Methanocalculus chunghsingensis]|uniref:Serine acetyltransferase n=1 Tax=Methanocalculus chunghsingensis TaxID=156457 RepID=A0A8J7W761_9EURY|nr:serine O-acetyltransferase [Methanocalculus chunghsingensis]MBR1368783.1 serine acetyltransferase [Methanocalculus chunghsingensis]